MDDSKSILEEENSDVVVADPDVDQEEDIDIDVEPDNNSDEEIGDDTLDSNNLERDISDEESDNEDADKISKINESNLDFTAKKDTESLIDKDNNSPILNNLNFSEYSNYDDDDNDSSDEILEKLQYNKNIINNNHLEINNINYKLLEELCIINRDSNNNIIDDNHKTIPILTKYEKTKIIGLRTKQINNGATPFVKVNSEIIDGEIIANMELEAKKIPYIIKRPISNNYFEYWRLEDLEII